MISPIRKITTKVIKKSLSAAWPLTPKNNTKVAAKEGASWHPGTSGKTSFSLFPNVHAPWIS